MRTLETNQLLKVVEFLESDYVDWGKIFGEDLPHDTYVKLFCSLIKNNPTQIMKTANLVGMTNHFHTQIKRLRVAKNKGLVAYIPDPNDRRAEIVIATDLLREKMRIYLQMRAVKTLTLAQCL